MSFLTYLRMAPWVAILALLIWAGRLNDLRDRWHHQAETYREKLESISTAKNEQKQTSGHTVTQVVEGQERVQTVVKTIHDAPNPSDCRTPGLETLRNVL